MDIWAYNGSLQYKHTNGKLLTSKVNGPQPARGATHPLLICVVLWRMTLQDTSASVGRNVRFSQFSSIHTDRSCHTDRVVSSESFMQAVAALGYTCDFSKDVEGDKCFY